MLRLARQRVGLKQTEASKKLSTTQPLLSRIENGFTVADEAFLQNASAVYHVPRSFFDLKEPVYGPPVSVHPMFRARSDVTIRDMDMVMAELNIRVMQMRRFLEAVDFQPTHILPVVDLEDYGTPSKVAALLRKHWMLPSGPIKDLTSLLEQAGVIVGVSDFNGASVSGLTVRVPGLPPVVLVNSAHPADRLRFTLAHELGHLVMHASPSPSMEDEANEFAAAFLMPEQDISEAFRGRKVTLALLADLKLMWRVSMQALLIRAKSCGFIDYNQSRYLWQQLSAKGWRINEPAELDFPQEEGKVLKSIIKAYLHDLGYSLADLCKLVPIYEDDFLKMYGPLDSNISRRPKLRLVT